MTNSLFNFSKIVQPISKEKTENHPDYGLHIDIEYFHVDIRHVRDGHLWLTKTKEDSDLLSKNRFFTNALVVVIRYHFE